MKDLGNWLLVFLMFFIRAFGAYVFIHMTVLLIALFCKFIINSTFDPEGHNTACAAIGVYFAMNTTYKLNGQRFRIWNKEFGFDDKKIDK